MKSESGSPIAPSKAADRVRLIVCARRAGFQGRAWSRRNGRAPRSRDNRAGVARAAGVL